MASMKIIAVCTLYLFSLSCNTPTEGRLANDSIQLKSDSLNENLSEKDAVLPNDKFRKDIVSKVTNPDDSKQFNALLDSLDKRDISYCHFLKRLHEIDDSYYAVAKVKYPAPEQQDRFSRAHSKAVRGAEARYLDSLKISDDLKTFAITAYYFDQKVNNFCGEY